MNTVTSPALWSTVAALPDYLLLAQTRQLARHEQALQILVLDHLREIEARRLHLTRGYGSLFDYVVHELGYTAAAAWRRIKAMRLCTQTGGARELLRDGSLNLSNAAQVQNLFERSDRSRGRPPRGHGVSSGPSGEPAPAPPTRGGERETGPVLDAAAREELVRRAAGKSTREVQQMLAEVDPALAQPSDRMRALGGGRWEMHAAIDAECRHGLEKLQMLLSHTDPHLTLGGLVARLVRDGLDRYDPARPRRTRRPGGGGPASVSDEQSGSTPVRRDAEAPQWSVVRTKGSDVERQSEVNQDDAPSAARDGVPVPSAAERDRQAEHGSASPAAAPSSGGHAAPPAKRHGQTELGSASRAAVPDTAAEHGGAKSAAVRDMVRRSNSAAKRVAQDEDVHTREAERLCGAAASAPGRHREAEHTCGQPKAVGGGGGRAASLAKRQGRADGNGRGARVAAARQFAYGAGRGASGPAERSPALERHLAALNCLDALPGSRSRYIPAAVRREVWRRDQGCCSYVDRHSGRRCGSRYRLEIDHIVPFALGGASEALNLRLHCGAHHRLRHAQRPAQPANVSAGARRAPVSAVGSGATTPPAKLCAAVTEAAINSPV